MLQSSSRGTPVSSDITKIIRQHYRPPSAKPYRHEQIQCRTDVSCKEDKPENYWTDNYRRRQSNLDRGFYTKAWEPYRPIGGELILDPYELVTSSLPGSMERKVHPRMTRRGTVYDFEKIVDAAQKAKKEEEEELLAKEASCLSEDLEDTCPSAGYDNIKKYINETRARIIAVRSGTPYEEHVRRVEELNRQQALSETPDEDMVIRSSDSTSAMIVQLPSPKFEEEDEDYGRSGSPRSILATSTRTSIDSAGRRQVLSPFDKRRWSCRRRLSSVKPPPSKVAVMKVDSGITSALLRKERQIRDQLDFLKSIYSILTALHNMKVRDLRTKVPLSKEAVEKLQKEGKDSQNDGGDRSGRTTQISRPHPHRGQQASSIDFDIGSEREESVSLAKPSVLSTICEKSRFSRKMMSTDTVDMVEPDSERASGRMSVYGTVKRLGAVDNISKSFFGRRRSRNISESLPQRPLLETWEDLLNVQRQEYKEDPAVSFGLQVGILTKFFRWYRRASITPTHAGANVLPTLDKDQLRHLEEVKDKGISERETHVQQPSVGSAAAGQEKVKKLPIWQQVAQEKSTVFLNKKHSAPNPYTMMQRFHRDLNKMKRSLEKENTAELEKLEREKVASFRLKFGALSQEECSIFEEQQYKMQQVKENFIKSHLENFDIQPSKWFEELREKSQSVQEPGDTEISDMIIKLQTFAHMDNKTVSYAKAKLCLLMMSLPAYDICQIQTQRALKFIFEQILLGQEAQFDEWLNHRKIPYMVLDRNNPVSRQRTPSPTFKPSSV